VTDLPEPLATRMRIAHDRWLVWCATEGVSPNAATQRQLVDCILDHRSALPIGELVDLLDQAAIASELFRTCDFLILRRGLN
jgi:hypothetical protein